MKLSKTSEKYSSNAVMVLVPATIAESCEHLEVSLRKIQPKLGPSLFVEDCGTFLTRHFPEKADFIKSAITKLVKGTKKCHICTNVLQTARKCLVFHEFDWEDVSYGPATIRVVCCSCEGLARWSRLMTAQLNQAMIESESDELTNLVEHFLAVNGHKISEISLFNSMVSLFASLRVSCEQLDPQLKVPEVEVEALIASLVSQK